MDQDMKTVVTSQPVRSSQHLESHLTDITAGFPPESQYVTGLTEKSGNGVMKENLTEVTAVFPPDTGDIEQEKRREQLRDATPTDCCCVYVGDDDPFFWYLLCRCICDFFRSIGTCTENCFESCANCLNSCCDDSGSVDEGCCCGCDGAGCGECVSGCFECCGSCDCDCSN